MSQQKCKTENNFRANVFGGTHVIEDLNERKAMTNGNNKNDMKLFQEQKYE